MTQMLWVLVIIAGGYIDRGVAITTVEMVSSEQCMAMGAHVRALKHGVSVDTFCVAKAYGN